MTEAPQDLLTLQRLRAQARAGTLRAVRSAAGLSLAEVARAAQVSARSVMRWERGLTVPHGPAAVRYGQLLDALMRGVP